MPLTPRPWLIAVLFGLLALSPAHAGMSPQEVIWFKDAKAWAEKGEAALGGRAEKIHSRLPWGEPPSTVSQSPVETCGED